jgi:hypothetical protein
MIFSKKKEYDERCSVKSSTIYKEQFILIVPFSFKKKEKFSGLFFATSKIGR